MMSGFTRTSRSISTRWLSSGISASFRSNCSSVAICGREKPGGLAKADALHGQRRLQRQAETDAALQRQVPPGRLLHRRDDPRLQAVGIEAEGDDRAADDDQRDKTRQRPQADAHQARECPPCQSPCHRVPVPPASAAAVDAPRARENPTCGTSPSCGAAGPPPPAMFRRRDGAGEARAHASEVRLRVPSTVAAKALF